MTRQPAVEKVPLKHGLAILLRHDQIVARTPSPTDPRTAAAARRTRSAQRSRDRSAAFKKEFGES
jgi:hypothetical protein